MTPSFRTATGGVVLILTASIFTPALAVEPQPGLWQHTTTTDMSGMNMPEMPAIPPEVLAQMEAAGVQMPNFSQPQTRTDQFCITPEDIANRQPFDMDDDDECRQENLQMDDDGMSVDIVCTGSMTGTGRIEYVFHSPTHMTGTMTMQGTSQGMSADISTNIEGNWLADDCGGVD